MSVSPQTKYITEQEYRDNEELSVDKHAWLNGRIWPMPIGSYNHTTIGGNITVAARIALKASPVKLIMRDNASKSNRTG